SFTFDLERDEGVSIGYMEPILINGFHANDCNVLAVGRNFHAICREHNPRCCPRSAPSFCHNDFVILRSSRLKYAGRVAHFPLQMAKWNHVLRAEAFPVEEKLNAIEIGFGLHEDLLAFSPRPVPVREQVQKRLVIPPCLVVKVRIFGETACIYYAELRTHAWPCIGRRLSTIVEAGPSESTREPGPGVVEVPPRLPFIHIGVWIDDVVRTYPVAQFVLRVNPPSEQCAGSLRADQKLFWVLLAIVVDLRKIVVETHHVEARCEGFAVGSIDCRSAKASRVQFVSALLHGV